MCFEIRDGGTLATLGVPRGFYGKEVPPAGELLR